MKSTVLISYFQLLFFCVGEAESDDEQNSDTDRILPTRNIRHRKTFGSDSKNSKHHINKGKTPRTATGYSSSDASDDDTDSRRRSEKFDIPKNGSRRGSKDGPPSGGPPSGGGGGGGSGTGSNGGTGSKNSSGNSTNNGGNGTENNSGNGGNNTGSTYEKKRTNEMRESLKTSNLSVNSNSSSTYSISKYAIDPNNTTPSDSEDQELTKSWTKKDNIDLEQLESKLYIIPKDTAKVVTDDSSCKNHLKRDNSNLSEKINLDMKDLNSHNQNSKSKHKEIRKKRNRISSTDCADVKIQTPAKSNSHCCRLI